MPRAGRRAGESESAAAGGCPAPVISGRVRVSSSSACPDAKPGSARPRHCAGAARAAPARPEGAARRAVVAPRALDHAVSCGRRRQQQREQQRQRQRWG